jgi:hypothetical protein
MLLPVWMSVCLSLSLSLSLSLTLTLTLCGGERQDWILIVAFSIPVILIDEVLKLIGRVASSRALDARMKAAKKQH